MLPTTWFVKYMATAEVFPDRVKLLKCSLSSCRQLANQFLIHSQGQTDCHYQNERTNSSDTGCGLQVFPGISFCIKIYLKDCSM